MNDFFSYDDADWELASAYLDNEATPDERVRVEASPALLDLVASLKRVQVTMALSPTSTAGVDAIIANALAASDGNETARVEPIVGSSLFPPPQGLPSPNASGVTPPAVSPVVSLDGIRRRRHGILRGPALLAAAVVTLFGLGFVLRPASETKSTSGELATSAMSNMSGTTAAATAAAGTTAATIAETAGDGANAPLSSEPVSGPITVAAVATTAAAAATTAAPAAAPAAAPPVASTAESPTTNVPTSLKNASSTTALSPPLAPSVPELTMQELRDLVVRSKDAQTTEACPDPTGLPRLAVFITWKDQPAVLFVDPVAKTLVILARDSCQSIAVIPLKDIAQS